MNSNRIRDVRVSKVYDLLTELLNCLGTMKTTTEQLLIVLAKSSVNVKKTLAHLQVLFVVMSVSTRSV